MRTNRRDTTVMRYKAAAQKFRWIAVLDAPVPAAVVVEPSSEDIAAVIDPASEDASAAAVIEPPFVNPFGVDAAAVEPLDADNLDGISAGGGRGVVDHLGAGATGYGRVRLRCGRNETRDKAIGNGRNGCKNRMSEEGPMETEDGLGLRCGRNRRAAYAVMFSGAMFPGRSGTGVFGDLLAEMRRMGVFGHLSK